MCIILPLRNLNLMSMDDDDKLAHLWILNEGMASKHGLKKTKKEFYNVFTGSR
jgi:hypothetical protein